LEGVTSRLAGGDVGGAIEMLTTKMTGLGFAGSAAFAVIGMGIYAAQRQLSEFHKSMDEIGVTLSKMPSVGREPGAFAKQFEDVSKSFKEMKGMGIGGTLMSILKDAGGGQGYERDVKEQTEKRAGLIDQMIRSLREEGNAVMGVSSAEATSLKLKQESAKIADEQKGRLAEIVQLTMSAGDKQRLINAENVTSLQKQIALREELIKKSPLKQIEEKSQMSMDEILAGPSIRKGGSQQLSIDQYWAKQAKMFEDLGMAAKKRGDQPEAIRLFTEAERVKSGIQLLSDKDKMPEVAFKNAINGAQVFQNMLSELKEMKGRLNNLGFANR
jgi:hypothetical protein